MRLSEIEKRARQKGIKDTWKYSKKELIRGIQKQEGNSQCFATGYRDRCGQMSCCWRPDCS
ncbi:MAG: SAP domain-containing protein [Candidatus Omnitrophota bacterium]